MIWGKLVIKCPRKPREGEGHLITNFPTYHGISL
jgi:hypothetical protein